MDRDYERFQSRVAWPSMAAACWIWTGKRDRYGYGAFHLDGRTVGAHRAAYEFIRGPIPAGLHIDHLCRIRACVNPLHMEPVTMATNTLRGESPQAVNARKLACKQGHAFTAANTYQWAAPGRSKARACRACRDAASRRYKARKAQAGA